MARRPVTSTGIIPATMPITDAQIRRLVEATEHDPFATLGLHPDGAAWVVRVYRVGANTLRWGGPDGAKFARLHPSGLFQIRLESPPTQPWQLWVDGQPQFDAYAFPPEPPADALYLFAEGRNTQSYRLLGALPHLRHGVVGVQFRVWAPNAARVSVVGEFNAWDGRCHPLATLGASGVWELFIPELAAGTRYKFELRHRASGTVLVRADPCARASEFRPATASLVYRSTHTWNDADWCRARGAWDWLHAPINIYELHAGSWMRHPDGRFYSYRELAARLIPYVLEHGYTHLEFLPLTEHPLDESWGYQTTGYFAPTSRFGSADDLKWLIDECHRAGLGVLLDWVPGHFPADDGALAHFDGSALYEHADPRLNRHPDWGTYIFNYGRNEVVSFLLSSAHYWLAEFHFDGLRVDAVASMLYLDYSRRAGEWVPNRFGGRENLEAIEFLRRLNDMVHREFPGVLTIAEESTSWPRVTHATSDGGLGFSLKWNMGWMNDTLSYLKLEPIHRRFHHGLLTFGQLYAYSERFLLPLSHDEVVHGKGSLPAKMAGDSWQRYANVRLLMLYQLSTPGKKLNFMGNEFGQPREWRSGWELDWAWMAEPAHAGLLRLASDLNHLYKANSALYDLDCEPGGFAWIECDDAPHSILSYTRRDRTGRHVLAVLNFTPVPRPGYRLPIPEAVQYRELINSDSAYYGGTNVGNLALLPSIDAHGNASLVLTLPPLAGLLLAPVDV